MRTERKITALAGGVGGAKLADGLAQCLPPGSLTVIVNTGDDFEHLGLYICPDLDTVCYTLAGKANSNTGWGRSDESWQALAAIDELKGPTWFNLGDRDLGLHLERTRRLRSGQRLSEVTAHICQSWGVASRVLPMSDTAWPTWVDTDEGELPFQEYFVHRQCQPHVRGFRFGAGGTAQPAPGVIDALAEADCVVICPSNPWVSVDPIFSIQGVREALSVRQARRLPVIAVSPIIGGQTVKGPAAKMFNELGLQASALAVARHYQGIIQGFVFDEVDASLEADIQNCGMKSLATNTLMKTSTDRSSLAETVLIFGGAITSTNEGKKSA